MSDTKFTSSPWVFHANNGSITDSSAAENEIAVVQTQDWHYLGMGYSNGDLLAAAPALYEKVAELHSYLTEEDKDYAGSYAELETEALLAKVRGDA
jgi:hypothetical protein